MFIGHFAVGFASKKLAPKASLGPLLAAPLLADILWPVFVLLGVERVRIVPGLMAFNPLDLEYYPWSHSLLMDCVWGLVFGGIYYAEHQSPHAVHQQAVRPRVVLEIERIERHEAGHDADALDAQQNEDRPQDVGEERGGEQRAQGGLGGKLLRREPDGEVADEHEWRRGDSNPGPNLTPMPLLRA